MSRSSVTLLAVALLSLVSMASATQVSVDVETESVADQRHDGDCGELPPCDGTYRVSPLTVSIWRGISLGRGSESCRINVIGLNIFGGQAGKLRGLETSLALNSIGADAVGVQISGIGNVVGAGCNDEPGGMVGAQFAGIGNVADGDVLGLQIAGIGNVADGSLHGMQACLIGNVVDGSGSKGLQIGGLGNVTTGDFDGGQLSCLGNVIDGGRARAVQMTGLGNVVSGTFSGMQVAGLGNVVDGEMYSERNYVMQAAGLGNVVTGDAFGVQTAFLGNVVAGDVTGLQIAGLGSVSDGTIWGGQIGLVGNYAGTLNGVQIGVKNKAEVANGVQIGIYNTAKEHHGYPIGIVTRVEGVPFRWAVSADEMGMISGQFRSGSERFNSIVMIGVAPVEDPSLLAYGFGLGPRFTPPSARTSVELDLLHRQLVRDGNWGDLHQVESVILRFGRKVAPGMKLTVGVSANVFISDQTDGTELAPVTLYDDGSSDTQVRIWPGLSVGVEF